jgi:hypothetical protein
VPLKANGVAGAAFAVAITREAAEIEATAKSMMADRRRGPLATTARMSART